MGLERRLGRLRTRWSGDVGPEDVAQEAVLRILRKRPTPRFADRRQLRAYLWRMARNVLVDLERRRSADRVRWNAANLLEADLECTGGIEAFERRERRSVLRSFLDRLRTVDREVLDLYYFRGQRLADIAQHCGVTVDAAHMRLVRARTRLERELRAAAGSARGGGPFLDHELAVDAP